MRLSAFPLLATSVAIATLSIAGPATAATEVVLRSEVTPQPLNPARGDASPQASVLWGDITKDVPSGAIIEFKEGFASPPHIHNITYRAVVIEGAVHNDDPDAATMWMGPGSFWTQPAGEDHITSTIAEEGATIFLEILKGPYLVQPSDQAFDNGEKPVNLEAGNMVWLDADAINWLEVPGQSQENGAEVAFLWGSTAPGEANGSLLKIPAGASGTISGDGDTLRAVVIQGDAELSGADIQGSSPLPSGSYFSANDDSAPLLTCTSDAECLFYVRTDGSFDFASR
ncbi:hypothetical protein C6W88_03160 [Halomonas litopenaei]|uniref:DUF4437 domain-containing protein n=1 Tax=Halomonas litopenaei TaxID=2109328 RepID=A0ABX5J2R1_9GAMM|nr:MULTISPECIES: DUF4437 domain-containing protein [Halomonas]PTL92710.1 hypothetical protein C6W89_02000 [Halomonas sp. SYSU XM8]PTL96386.1 hypothetical protein C6W88_03160 [Halomonas litopenaei]